LSRILEGNISKETLQGANYHPRSGRIVRPLDMACILRFTWKSRRHKRP